MSIDPIHIANAATARALYLDNLRPEEASADWHFAIRDARRAVAAALRNSMFLIDIASALEADGGHCLVFRHLLAPPLSQDQFKLICPNWSKNSENKSRPLPAAASSSAASAILRRLDRGLCRWVDTGRVPSRGDLVAVFKVVATLIASQKLATSRRKRLAFDQEYSIVRMLEEDGWTKLSSRLIDNRATLPQRHFMHKTRFATATSAPKEVDIACGLDSAVVLALECKVTNDETNSVKRIDDVLNKAKAWTEQWGRTVVTAALLQGVVAAKDVQRLSDAHVVVFWSHDLPAFRAWLAARA